MRRASVWIVMGSLGLCLLGVGCGLGDGSSQPVQEPVTDSNSNWLSTCTSDAQCNGQEQCLCGVCTLPCQEDACSRFSDDAICVFVGDAPYKALCTGNSPPVGICLPSCNGDSDCSIDQACDAGVCVPVPEDPRGRSIEQSESETPPVEVDRARPRPTRPNVVGPGDISDDVADGRPDHDIDNVRPDEDLDTSIDPVVDRLYPGPCQELVRGPRPSRITWTYGRHNGELRAERREVDLGVNDEIDETWLYRYDDAQHVRQEVLINLENREILRTLTWRHDRAGRLLTFEEDRTGDGHIDVMTWYIYNRQGQLWKTETDLRNNGRRNQRLEYFYSDAGVLTHIDFDRNLDGDIDSRTRLRHNRAGYVVTEGEDLGADGQVDNVTSWTYDHAGNVLRRDLDRGFDEVIDEASMFNYACFR